MSGVPRAPYATDGTDARGAVRYHYGVALKRFVKFFPVFLLMWVQLFVWQSGYLLPVAIVGFFGALWTLLLFGSRMVRVWKCSRVLRTYHLQFRTPVEKIGQESSHTLYLRLGGRGDRSFTLRAKDVVGRGGWPAGITAGVWFAGDEPFGGAIIVPGSGELFFLQPKDWAARDEDRNRAGLERIERAGRAGIKRPARFK